MIVINREEKMLELIEVNKVQVTQDSAESWEVRIFPTGQSTPQTLIPTPREVIEIRDQNKRIVVVRKAQVTWHVPEPKP